MISHLIVSYDLTYILSIALSTASYFIVYKSGQLLQVCVLSF